MKKKETCKLKLLVLLSGNGSTLQAIINAIDSGQLDAEITAVISDQAHAYGLKRASAAHIKTQVIARDTDENRADYNHKLLEALQQQEADLIVLAGFMRILGPNIVSAYEGHIINIHPALLPKYPGLDTHTRALESGDTQHGSSIHFVTNTLDGGPLIAQAACPILATDTTTTLEDRVKKLEHQLYPHVLQWFAENRIQWSPEGVLLDGKILEPTKTLLTNLKPC